jgi:hypothetical protein
MTDANSIILAILVGSTALSGAQSKTMLPCEGLQILVGRHAATPIVSPVGDGKFGKACSTGAHERGHEKLAQHAVCELLGPGVQKVVIQHYPAQPGNNSRQVVVDLRRVLRAVPQEPPESYIAWSEFVSSGIVAQVKFRNGESTALEESAGHVCFVDRDHNVWFARLRIKNLINH